MFGGHETVPTNSPHLRKSGSRQLFSELETAETKGAGGTQLASAAMLPSSVLLWRLKVLLYTAVAVILIFPFDVFYLSSRFFLLKTLW